jgi:hypothetical protein
MLTRMSDELPFDSPKYKLPEAPRTARRTALEPVGGRRALVLCELRFHGESYGLDAQILRNGELFTDHAFVLKGDAIRWGEEQRKGAERGFLQDY